MGNKMGRLIFLIIIILSLVVRISSFDFPFNYIFEWGDGTRDYLVANHIVKYKEFPLVGPFNLLYEGGIRNSPLYFYLLAVMLVPFNHVLTLSAINIVLQIGVIILVYFISKKIFNQVTALVAMTLFSFNPEVLRQSDYIWQPHLMLVFVLVSLLLFLYKKKVISFFVLALASAIHNSAVPWIPVFLLLVSFKDKVKGSIIFILSSILFYLPLVFYYFKQPGIFNLNLESNQIYIRSINEYFSNLVINIGFLLQAFGLNSTAHYLVVLILIFVYLILVKKTIPDKRGMFFVVALVFLPIVSAAFFNKVRLHYLTLSMPIFAILIAKLIVSIPKWKLGYLIPIIFLLFFLKIFTGDFKTFSSFKEPLINQKLLAQITREILKEDLDSFQVRSYAVSANSAFYYPILDTVLLVPLEQTLNKKIVRLFDNSAYNHQQIGSDKYIVVGCMFRDKIINDEKCLEVFEKDHPNYSIEKNIYLGYPISVYLAKRS